MNRRRGWWLLVVLAAALILPNAPALATVDDPVDSAGADTTPDVTPDTTDADPDATGVPDVPNPYLDYGPPPVMPAMPEPPPPPVLVGSGADALIRAPDLRGTNEPTLLERYGAQGFSAGVEPVTGEPTGAALNAVAAGLFGVATWVAQAVIAAVQWVFTIDLFAFMGDAVSTMVDALAGLVYAPFAQAAVVLAGLWLVWHGMVRRRATMAAEGTVWTVLALVAAGVFFTNPAALLDGANHLSTGLSRAVLAGVSVADPQTGPEDGVATVGTFDGHPADTQLRVAGDRFWRVFVYEPWLVLQFGDADAGAEYGERLLATRTITAEEHDAVAGDPDELTALGEDKRADAATLREDILRDERLAAWYSGRRPVERTGVASLALIGVLLGGVLLAVVAAAILLAQIALLLLVVLAPLALLAGIHPGAGRVIAVRWAELAIGVLLRRVALGALLGVILVVNGVLLDATHPLGWFVVVSLQALVVGAAIVYRRAFSRLFAPTTVPHLDPERMRRARDTLQGHTSRRLDEWRTVQATGAGHRAGPSRPGGTRTTETPSTGSSGPRRRPHAGAPARPGASEQGSAEQAVARGHGLAARRRTATVRPVPPGESAGNGHLGNGHLGNGRAPGDGTASSPGSPPP